MRCAPKTIINSHVSCVVVVGYRSLAVGSKHGFSLFSLTSIDSALEEIYSSSGEEINIVERLFSSSLVAVVSLNAPRKLKVCVNFGQSARYCTHIYNFNCGFLVFYCICCRCVISKKEPKYAIIRIRIRYLASN